MNNFVNYQNINSFGLFILMPINTMKSLVSIRALFIQGIPRMCRKSHPTRCFSFLFWRLEVFYGLIAKSIQLLSTHDYICNSFSRAMNFRCHNLLYYSFKFLSQRFHQILVKMAQCWNSKMLVIDSFGLFWAQIFENCFHDFLKDFTFRLKIHANTFSITFELTLTIALNKNLVSLIFSLDQNSSSLNHLLFDKGMIY